MAKKKPRKKKKKNSTPVKKDHLSKFGVMKSPFITKLLDTIPAAESAGTIWGDDFEDRDNKQLIGEDIANAFRLMFKKLEVKPRPAPDPAAAGSATLLLLNITNETGWPDNFEDFPTPKPWKPGSFRRYEVAAAVNILMKAYDQHAPTGGPETWPPERPK